MADPTDHGASDQVTQILGALAAGRTEAGDALLPLVYDDLRRLAAARMARLSPGQTLQATELVHEAYMRLVGSADPGWQGRAHFFGAAARAMRNVLADHLRRKGSLKRGGRYRRLGEHAVAGLSCEGPSDDVLALEEALQHLEREFPRKAQVMTLSFFGGLNAAEIGEVMGLSTRTVEREGRFGKAWLNSRLSDDGQRS
ncbi:MAG: RNA polymerase subunit sigma [Planctomycetota bacterium]|nr:MAG: RNA polymerase subunit sigma [Planctomycetota bacterium]